MPGYRAWGMGDRGWPGEGWEDERSRKGAGLRDWEGGGGQYLRV